MFYKIQEVHTAVFRYFSKRIQSELPGVNVRYARKSSKDYTEEQQQQLYPCVALQEYSPVPRENWWIEHKAFARASSTDGTTGYLYYLPIFMDFRYDISIAAKSYTEYLQLQQWFLENTIAVDEITLQPHAVGEYEAGEPITIETRAQDIPRTDGVYETNYEVTFQIWLYARQPVGLEAVQNVSIKLHRVKTPIAPGADFSYDFNDDYALVRYRDSQWRFPYDTITDRIALLLLELDGYSGIMDITQADYDALAEKDPDMIYIIV